MRLLPTLLAALVLAAPALAAAADPEETAAVAVVQRFFDAMAKADGAAVTDVTLPGSVFTAVRPEPGGTRVSRITLDEFVKNLRPGLNERMWSPRVSLRGAMIATVSAPYEFQRDGKTTHCGIDVFTLAKVEGQWKIAGLLWTAEPDACPELKARS